MAADVGPAVEALKSKTEAVIDHHALQMAQVTVLEGAARAWGAARKRVRA